MSLRESGVPRALEMLEPRSPGASVPSRFRHVRRAVAREEFPSARKDLLCDRPQWLGDLVSSAEDTG